MTCPAGRAAVSPQLPCQFCQPGSLPPPDVSFTSFRKVCVSSQVALLRNRALPAALCVPLAKLTILPATIKVWRRHKAILSLNWYLCRLCELSSWHYRGCQREPSVFSARNSRAERFFFVFQTTGPINVLSLSSVHLRIRSRLYYVYRMR
jgi:hypothetical protein